MKRSRRCSALFALVACAGCMGKVPPTHYYTLAPPAAAVDGALVAAVEGHSIGVESFAVDPPYDQDRLVYRSAAGAAEVGFYSYHRWAAAPGRLVASALAEGLRGTPGVGAIEPVTSLGEYTALLSGRVLYIEEVERAGVSEARIGLELRLEGADGKPLWSETFAAAAPAIADAGAVGAAAGGARTMRSVQAAFERLVDKVRGSLAAALGP